MMSLRTRLIASFVAPTSLIVLVLVSVGYFSARQGLEEELDRRLEAVGLVLATEFSEGLDAEQLARLEVEMVRVRTRLRERLQVTKEATGVERITIFDSQASTLIDSGSPEVFGATLHRVQADRSFWELGFSEGQSTVAPLFEDQDGTYYKTAYVPITLDGETVAMIAVIAGATYFDLLTGFTTVLTLLGTLGVILVVLVGFWFSGRLVGPLRELVTGAEQLREGDLKTPVRLTSTSGTAELDSLGTSFEKMREAILQRDQQMQMMLAGIAHEIRNPLGGIELFCGLLREDLLASDRQDEVEMVVKIERELAYLKRVVDDFLTFSRPEDVAPRRVKAREFISEVEEVVQGDLLKRQCDLHVQVEQNLELTVDIVRMRRGLINVIRNACEASAPGDQILIRLFAQGEQRVMEVVDYGDGIDPKILEKVDQPFFTTREKGSGLGLSLTRKILESHRGSLEIESEKGKGTTLRFILPFDESLATEESFSSEEIPEGWLG